MRLLELFDSRGAVLTMAVQALEQHVGPLDRVGGAERVYEVTGAGHPARGAIFVPKRATNGVGVAWTAQEGISAIYVWKELDLNKAPDYVVQIPRDIAFERVAPTVAAFIENPRLGRFELAESADGSGFVILEAKRTTEENFLQLARNKFGDRASKLTIQDLMACAEENDVLIPSVIRSGYKIKGDAHHWDLSDKSNDVGSDMAVKTGQGASNDPADEIDPRFRELQQAQTVRDLASENKIAIFGRSANGVQFEIKGAALYASKLARMLEKQLEDQGGPDRESMEQQYELLGDRVELVAGGQSTFIKSLLITGAPSSGKSYTVMKTIKKLGLHEGKDYIIKKGKVTTLSMYRTLIEQIEGLVIFDDCDSVVQDANAINMLKGALDTDPVREISYDVRGTINTAVMEQDERIAFVDRVSRVLRGKPGKDDLSFFEARMKKKKDGGERDKKAEADPWDDGYGSITDGDVGGGEMFNHYKFDDDEDKEEERDPELEARIHEVQTWLASHLPNKIDYRGRIIFISNLPEAEWDGAILTRAFTMNMNFSSVEMLNFIERIKGSIEAPNLTEDQKTETLQYLRELWETGSLKRDINFRLVQQAFDLRLTTNWKKLLATL